MYGNIMHDRIVIIPILITTYYLQEKSDFCKVVIIIVAKVI